MKKVTSESLIKERDIAIRNLKNNWEIIKTHNEHDDRKKKEFDLHNVYKDILQNEVRVVEAKLYLQCINMGLGNISQLSENSSYNMIFRLSQLKDRRNQLVAIKNRKKREGKFIKTILKDEFFDTQIAETDQEIAVLNKKLADFNAEKTFMIEG